MGGVNLEPGVLGCEYPPVREHGDLWHSSNDSTMLQVPTEGWSQAASLAVAHEP